MSQFTPGVIILIFCTGQISPLSRFTPGYFSHVLYRASLFTPGVIIPIFCTGRRGKVRTRDGNDIDTVFVDRRNRHSDGQYLVVCSEGNAAFYEVGCMTTPIESEYRCVNMSRYGLSFSLCACFSVCMSFCLCVCV